MQLQSKKTNADTMTRSAGRVAYDVIIPKMSGLKVHLAQGLAQAKIIKKSVILFRVPNMTI